MQKLIQPVEYTPRTDIINQVTTTRQGVIIGVIEPVTGYGNYTHLVVLDSEACGVSFGLAKLADTEVSSIPAWNYGEWLDSDFGV